MSFTAPEDAFLDVNDAHLRVYGNVHADGLKLGQLEIVTTTSTGSTIQFLHQHTAFTTTSNIEVGTTNHDLFVDTKNSRVGILTNTPTTALDVTGTVKATAFDGNGALLTGIPSSAINGTLSQWTTVTGPKIHYSDGNVGIGIADPLHTLDVVGDINFTGILRKESNPFVSTPWTIESGPTALSYTLGNVGVGGTTPSAKLEVTGNAHVSTDLSVGGNLTINTISAAATHGLGAVTALSNTSADTVLLTNTGTSLVASGAVQAVSFTDGTETLTGGAWSGSAATLSTPRTIGGVPFDGSAAIVPTTFGAATFSGDLTVSGKVTRQYNPGEIIEELNTVCNGRPVTVQSGTYTPTNVTSSQTSSSTHTEVNGSNITYNKPAGAKRIYYKFACHWEDAGSGALTNFKIQVYHNGGWKDINLSRYLHSAQYRSDTNSHGSMWVINEYIFECDADTESQHDGYFLSSKTSYQFRVTWRHHGNGYNSVLHMTDWWDGSGTNIIHPPQLTIRAIA